MTQKSQYLGDYAEAWVTADAIYSLADGLLWRISDAVADTDKTPAERVTLVDAMLTEFHAIALRVATALINGMGDQPAADAAKALKQTREVLTKSLTTQTTELNAVKEAIQERDAALTQATERLAEKDARVQALTDQWSAREAREARVYSPFDSMVFEAMGKFSAQGDQETRPGLLVGGPGYHPRKDHGTVRVNTSTWEA